MVRTIRLTPVGLKPRQEVTINMEYPEINILHQNPNLSLINPVFFIKMPKFITNLKKKITHHSPSSTNVHNYYPKTQEVIPRF